MYVRLCDTLNIEQNKRVFCEFTFRCKETDGKRIDRSEFRDLQTEHSAERCSLIYV
jgi:hypothetical protein